MSDATTDGWFFAQQREKHGPVTWSRLQHLATTGWLAPGDLVWHPTLPAWTAADQIPGLHQGRFSRLLTAAIPGVKIPASGEPPPHRPAAPDRPADVPRPRRRRSRRPSRSPTATFDIEALPLRHVIAVCGVLLTALGIAFTVIRGSPLAMALIVSGLFIVAAGLALDIGRLAARGAGRLAEEWRKSAAHRLRARELALEHKRLDVEAARLAAASEPVEPAGRLVVINEQPVQQWSRVVAGLMSLVCPGLGQLYKGQVVNGIVWLFIVITGYKSMIALGIILHVCGVLGALSGNPWTEGRTTVVRE